MAGAWVTSAENYFSLIVNDMYGLTTGVVSSNVNADDLLFRNRTTDKWQLTQSDLDWEFAIANQNGTTDQNISILQLSPLYVPPVPLAPTSVNANDWAAGETIIDVFWSLSDDATSYNVSRSSTGSGGTYYSQVTGVEDDTWRDNAANLNVEYCYKVSATGPGGTSALSTAYACATAQEACFIEGTLISIGDNIQIPIETLYEGTMLLSPQISSLIDTNNIEELYNWTSSDEILLTENYSPITKIDKVESTETISINDGLIEASNKHSQLVRRNNVWQFMRIENVLVNDMLYDINNELIEITSVEKKFDKCTVYKLSLSPSHTFYANGILTHNVK